MRYNYACDRTTNLTVLIGLTLIIQHITPKHTFIKYIILGNNSGKEFNDNIEPATITHVIEQQT